MIKNLPKKGSLLVAEPFAMNDGYFNRSVILLTEYNDNGCVGFILNKALSYKVSDLIPEIEADFPVYKGGPVEVDNLYFIHNVPHLLKDSIEINPGIFWGGNFELLKELINSNMISEENVKFFLGYSGWDKDQLENEIDDLAWTLMHKEISEQLFKENLNNFWHQKMKELGDSYVLFANSPEDPSLN